MKHNKMLGLPSLPVSATIIIQRESHMSIDIYQQTKNNPKRKEEEIQEEKDLREERLIHPSQNQGLGTYSNSGSKRRPGIDYTERQISPEIFPQAH